MLLAQWINDPASVCGDAGLIPGPTQWVKNPVLSQLWCGLLLRLLSDPAKKKFFDRFLCISFISCNLPEFSLF